MGERFDPGRVVVADLLDSLGIEARHERGAWWASCPLGTHRDSDPSWKIRDLPDESLNGASHCFSCKGGGGAIQLVQRVLGLYSSTVAIDWIRERAYGVPRSALGVEVVVRVPRPRFHMPALVRFEPLKLWPGPAQSYARARGITDRQSERWGLGYAVEGELAGRIVVPTRNARGLPVSFAARTFAGHPKRYLSPRTDSGFDPGAVCGEHLWPPPQPGLRRNLVLTEGALNALAVERVLVESSHNGWGVGAVSGSHVHLGQVTRACTWEHVLLLTDPDPAGDRAAEAFTAALARHARVTRVRLPEGEDAASVSPADLANALRARMPV